ncbi:hypothetical protein [Halorubrum sp. HHNYT27]|uniref:hypothetical protein n=1 Tax=Halorubrum sp. HHNYT27 TaxID=3402275 RepID=UPI003EBD150E
MSNLATVAVLSLQGGIFALFLVAVRRGDVAAAVNASAALVLALLPFFVELVFQETVSSGVWVGPALPLWLSGAGFLHSLGMLGLYDSIRWWDHLTHTVSAALFAALCYGVVIVALPEAAGVGGVFEAAALVTVAFTFAGGVFWELIELVARDVGERFEVEPVLIHYGWRDTAADLGFDVVGAALVVVADLRLFVPLVERFPEASRAVLVGAGLVVFAGSVAMASWLVLSDSTTA